MIVSRIAVVVTYLLSAGALFLHLSPLQRAQYRPWPRYGRGGCLLRIVMGVYVILLCGAWFLVVPDARLQPICIALCYAPIAIEMIGTGRRRRLRMTHRVTRLWILAAGILLLPAAVILILPRYLLAWGLLSACGYVAASLAAAILYPIEEGRNRRFICRMRDKLRASGALVVGVTGSAGKTGVKRLLMAALGAGAYATPGNYNTPMGIALTVRDMPDGIRWFVAEMGVGKPGDMRDLLDIVKPDVGVVTAVLPQHTAHFDGLEAIRREKCMLLDAAAWRVCHTSVGYPSECSYGDGGDWWAENVRLALDCTTFDLCGRGVRYTVRLPLLGRQSVENALCAWAVAMHLEKSPEQVLAGWRDVLPEQHRLTRMQNAAGVWIVDDSYNCNVAGAAYALEYVGLYAGRKVVTVSGIDESDAALHLNRRLGEMIAAHADIAVIVGDRYRDELEAGMAGKIPVYPVATTADSVALYGTLLHAGDVVLIMADYPM